MLTCLQLFSELLNVKYTEEFVQNVWQDAIVKYVHNRIESVRIMVNESADIHVKYGAIY